MIYQQTHTDLFQTDNQVIVCVYMSPNDLSQNSTPLSQPLIIQVQIELSPTFQWFLQNECSATVEFFQLSPENSQLQTPRVRAQKTKRQNYTTQLIQQQLANNTQIQPTHPSQLKPQAELQNFQIYQEIEPSKLNIHYFRKKLHHMLASNTDPSILKEFLQEYLVEDNLGEDINQNLQHIVEIIQWNLRKVGNISWLQRRQKLNKFKNKKKARIWQKKVSYDCRKRVADERLRVKGKFITKEQAYTMLGIEECPQEELKSRLQQKFGKNNIS